MKKITMRKTVYGLVVLFFAFLMMTVTSCNENDSAANKARLEVRLTDAPGEYEEVNVDIQDVQVNSQDSDNSGWQSLDIKKGVYDLKQLTNGVDTLLGSAELPTGKIAQLRLILGTNNTVKIGGQSFPLTTPSAQQSGLKVQINQDLKEGITYKVLLDFDAALSVVARGNGAFNLKPVIRSITQALDGAIKGSVKPANAKPSVFAITGTDTISTSVDTTSGAFLVKGLQAGTYKVVIGATSEYQSKEVTNVSVVNGQVTDVGVVELTHL